MEEGEGHGGRDTAQREVMKHFKKVWVVEQGLGGDTAEEEKRTSRFGDQQKNQGSGENSLS